MTAREMQRRSAKARWSGKTTESRRREMSALAKARWAKTARKPKRVDSTPTLLRLADNGQAAGVPARDGFFCCEHCSHVVLLSQHAVDADAQMISDWNCFANERSLPQFSSGMAWSFSALFRETVADVYRVKKLGCSVVEMEAATLPLPTRTREGVGDAVTAVDRGSKLAAEDSPKSGLLS